MNFPKIINVTDHKIDCSNFSSQWKQNVIELSHKILEKYYASKKDRYIVVLGGPSGSGKSTIAATLKSILENTQDNIEIVNVSQDAYHYPNDYLIDHSLKKYKGRYDTFDIKSLFDDISDFSEGKNILFPYYSRELHESIKSHISVNNKKSILILEGLWLLYDQTPWKTLLPFYDHSLFVKGDESFLKENTIMRHIQGGRTHQDAEEFYTKSDLKNTDLIINNVAQHDEKFKVE